MPNTATQYHDSMTTNRQRAAALLANRFYNSLFGDIDREEVQDALGESTAFKDATIEQVAELATDMAQDIIAQLDGVYGPTDRWPLPELSAEGGAK